MASDTLPAGTISSIIPVYNGARYIEAAIESLLNQSAPPAQIIVIDDGSTDDSGARAVAAGGPAVQLVRQANAGMVAARNVAIGLSTGDYLHFLDADDLCPDGALEAMRTELEANPGWYGLFGLWRNFWIEELAGEEETEAAAHLRGVQQGQLMNAGLFRGEWLRTAPAIHSTDEWHGPILWLAERQKEGALFGRIDAIVLERRIHHTNMSRGKTREDFVNLAFQLHRAARGRPDRAVSNAGNEDE